MSGSRVSFSSRDNSIFQPKVLVWFVYRKGYSSFGCNNLKKQTNKTKSKKKKTTTTLAFACMMPFCLFVGDGFYFYFLILLLF